MGYQDAIREARQVVRRSVLDGASDLLESEGPHALSMRRVSERAGCSTMVLYRMFGGKDGLVRALYEEGYVRLRQKIASVPDSAGPGERLAGLARAYRAFALENPTYFSLMVGRPIAEFEPPEALTMRQDESFQVLLQVAGECAAAGLLSASTGISDAADILWASVHGMVSLELKGYFPDRAEADRRFEQMLTVVGRGLASP